MPALHEKNGSKQLRENFIPQVYATNAAPVFGFTLFLKGCKMTGSDD